MNSHLIKVIMVSSALLFAASPFAFADCEADLVQLEGAMKTPGVTPDQTKMLQDAGDKASTALRKDDDAACHQIVSDALASIGGKVQKAASTGVGLGDLTPLRTIADDTLKLVQKGDMPAAKARITNLESAWDKARPSLQPKDPAAWDSLDHAIDAALTHVRATNPDPKASADALTQLTTLLSK